MAKLFGGPKRKNAKGRGTFDEEFVAEMRTRQKYPQMFEEGGKGAPKKSWGSPTSRTTKTTAQHNLRTKAVKRGMSDSAGGIKTDVEKEEEKRRRGK
jgi:hypothetical protein